MIGPPPPEVFGPSSAATAPSGIPSAGGPSFDTADQPAFEQPPASRAWVVGLAVLALVLLGGLGMLFKDRRPAASVEAPVVAPVVTAATTGQLSVVTPVMVKVFEGKQELGSSPLEIELPLGPHTVRVFISEHG